MNKLIKILLIITLVFFIENIFSSYIYTVHGEDGEISWAAGAKNFVESADPNIKINDDKINEPSSQIYNVLTSIGMIVAVSVGAVLGIKYMFTSVEEKANVLETMIPYLIGCVVTFGAFGIWKIFINTFYNI